MTTSHTVQDSGGHPAREDDDFPRFLTREMAYLRPPERWRPRLFHRLRMDLCAKSAFLFCATGRKHSLTALMKDGSLATLLFRMTHALSRMHLGLLAIILYKLSSMITGAVIGRRADLGPGLVILHGHGVTINSAVRAGKNLVLGNNVTIGTEKGKTPILGDNVYIGAGAVLIGEIHIGNRVRIGANAVVNQDVPDDATVVGIPARVVKIRSHPDNSFSMTGDD